MPHMAMKAHLNMAKMYKIVSMHVNIKIIGNKTNPITIDKNLIRSVHQGLTLIIYVHTGTVSLMLKGRAQRTY